MARVATYIIWIAVMIGITGGLHYYFWARLARDTELSSTWRTALTVFIITMGVSIPLTFFIGRFSSATWRDALVWVAFVWLGVMFLLFLFLLSGDAIRWGSAIASRLLHGEAGHDPSRRLMISRMLAGGAALGSLGMSALAVRKAMVPPALKKVQVTLSRLPEKLSGTTIVQISDLHVGETIGRNFVADVVERTNALNPDIIAITGDLVDGGTVHLREEIAPLAELRAKRGIFFVTGNHEYYSGVEPWIRFLTEMGIRVLRNERVSIGDEEASFDLAGVDDHTAGRHVPGHGPDVAAALAGCDPDREVVLLAHQPKEIYEAAKHGVGLVLSGHTHGGQIWPFTFFVRLAQPYIAGLFQHNERTQIYVSRGTGHWGPPMRLAAPSELTQIELVSDAHAELEPS